MITILLIIFLGIIICYTFRIYKLKKEGFSIFDGSFFDFGQQKMYMEFRKGGSGDQIGETDKGFTHEIKNIVGELGSSGGQQEYKGETSFSQNLDVIQEDNSATVSKSFKNATKVQNKLNNVGTYARNNAISKEEAFYACFLDSDTWSNDNYAVLHNASTEKKTNGENGNEYKPSCVGVAYSGPNKLSKNGTYYLLGNCLNDAGEGDCFYYDDDNKEGETFFNGMEKVTNPWRPVGTETTSHPMIIDKVWYLDKGSGSNNDYSLEEMKDVLKIAVLDPKTYDNDSEMVLNAENICSKGLEFSKVNNISEKTGNWFKDPEQGTYKNIKCVGFSMDGLKEGDKFTEKPKITFYGIPESNLDKTWKKIKLDLDSNVVGTIDKYIFEKTGSLTNSYKILNAVNTDISGNLRSCRNTRNCQEICRDDENCIGYQQIDTDPRTYRLLRNGFVDVSKDSYKDTYDIEKKRYVYKHTSRYDTLSKNFLDIENSNKNNNLFTTIINSNDNYKDIIENEKNNVDALIANLKNLLGETDPSLSPDLKKCEVLQKLKKYHVQYHRLYKNGSDDSLETKNRHGKKIGLMKYYEKSFKDMEINQIRKSSGNETNMALMSKRGVSNNWWESLGNFFITTTYDDGDSFLENELGTGKETREMAIKKLLQQNYINMDKWVIKEVDGQGDLYTGSKTKDDIAICKCKGEIGTYTRGCDLSNVQLKAIGSNKNFDDDDVNGVSSYEKFFNILNDDCDGVNSLKCITYGDISGIEIEFDGYYDKGWAFQNCGNYSFDNLNLKTGKFNMITNDLSCNMGSEYIDVPVNVRFDEGKFSGCKECGAGYQNTSPGRTKCTEFDAGEGCEALGKD